MKKITALMATLALIAISATAFAGDVHCKHDVNGDCTQVKAERPTNMNPIDYT